MPEVVGLTLDAAQAVLHGAGLNFRIERHQSRVVPEGVLMTVVPSPGTPVDEDTDIVLVVSSGPPLLNR
jgi:beta-lactam-binding protein with PASTA domain